MFILTADAQGNHYAINSDYIISISQNNNCVNIDMAEGKNISLKFNHRNSADNMFNYITDKVRGVYK